MPGEFKDLIPLPTRNQRRRVAPVVFDADDVSFAARLPVDQDILDADGLAGFVGGLQNAPTVQFAPTIQDDPAIDDPDGLRGFAGLSGAPIKPPQTGPRNDPTAVLRDRTGALRQIGAFEAGLLGGIQGATGGFLDETVGGVIALLAKADGDNRPFDEIFAEKVAPVRLLIEESRRQQPAASTVSEIVGAAAGPGKVLRLSGLTTRATARLREKALGAALENAAVGGLIGVGNADGRDLVVEGGKGILGGSVLGAAGAVAGKGVGLAIDKAAGRFKNVPTLDVVKETARTIFKGAGAAGVRVAQPVFRKFTTQATAFANRQKAFPKNAPGTAKVLQSMERLSGKNPTFLELRRLRESMRRVVERAKPGSADRRLVEKIMASLDRSVSNMSFRSVDGVDPRLAKQILPDIKDFWRRAGNGQIIDDVFETARRKAGPNFKRSEFREALRREFKLLAGDDVRLQGFASGEQGAIRRVANGGPLEKSLVRIVNSLADPSRSSTEFVRFGGEAAGTFAATAIGNTLEDQGAAAAGVLGRRLPEATVAAGRALERGLMQRGAKNVGLMVRNGGILPPQTPLAEETSALVRLGLAGQGRNVVERAEEFFLPAP